MMCRQHTKIQCHNVLGKVHNRQEPIYGKQLGVHFQWSVSDNDFEMDKS